jgi:AAA+ ATPase superfamily predicted ATPase
MTESALEPLNMEPVLQSILESLPPKSPRSKLEPHRELIRELRRKRRTYREVAQLFHERLGFGRFNAGIFHLDPLQYEDVACFYANRPAYGVVEKLLMYAVFGGTPRYYALVDPSRPPAEEIVTLLMQPRAILENEVRLLLGSEQIRDPAPYNAILAAVAGGETKFNGIQQLIGVERGAFSKSLRTLLERGWIRRELSFEDTSDRRALYRVADPFLAFWYRFVAPQASDLQFSDPTTVYAAHVAPRLAEYMGCSVFEEICAQWLQRHAKQRLGLTIRQMARYWSRDGRTEIDLMAELAH